MCLLTQQRFKNSWRIAKIGKISCLFTCFARTVTDVAELTKDLAHSTAGCWTYAMSDEKEKQEKLTGEGWSDIREKKRGYVHSLS
jgi:hypothetical protein